MSWFLLFSINIFIMEEKDPFFFIAYQNSRKKQEARRVFPLTGTQYTNRVIWGFRKFPQFNYYFFYFWKPIDGKYFHQFGFQLQYKSLLLLSPLTEVSMFVICSPFSFKKKGPVLSMFWTQSGCGGITKRFQENIVLFNVANVGIFISNSCRSWWSKYYI